MAGIRSGALVDIISVAAEGIIDISSANASAFPCCNLSTARKSRSRNSSGFSFMALLWRSVYVPFIASMVLPCIRLAFALRQYPLLLLC